MARHVPHLLVPGPWDGETIPLGRAQDSHLRRVLRRVDGDSVSYTDGAGRIGAGVLGPAGVVRGEERREPPPKGPVIASAPPSEKERARFLVEKLAELGVPELWWLSTRFGDTTPPSEQRSEAWSRAGLEQSRAAWSMRIRPGLVSCEELPAGTVFADREGAVHRILGAVPCIAIGPAGGWSPDEVPDGAPTVAFGSTILRVETAAVAAAVRAMTV